ncbi:hypothetical protein COV20_05160 [Candidatus Woesearchaeota archaeon CG10_big_fil_rev_8_21_14_0_10_45_16]|nr:MAG: hypothetical protein COV20_05160 [Candidatus Woesearchaeota archaeon CG10_big_fil_rev_8_21_14_0_10_45_16]
MGWLFGKKKVPKVPLPEGHLVDDRALRFPSSPTSRERVIEPEKVKEAVGIGSKPMMKEESIFPTAAPAPMPKPKMSKMPPMPRPMVSRRPVPEPMMERSPMESMSMEGPLFVKVDVYQRVLGEIDQVKEDLQQLGHLSRELEASGFNNEDNFTKLKRSVKNMHDKLLSMDKVLFKSQGD